MNVSNLKIGMVIKNYKELCYLLEVNPVGGKSKILQLERLSKLIKYSKNKNSFIIEDIYTNTLEPTKIRNSLFIDDLENVILYGLDNIENNNLFFSVSKALQFANLVNSNYSNSRLNPELTAQNYEVSIECVVDFFTRTQKQLKRTFERSLDRLRKKALIMWEIDTIIVINNNHIKASYTDKEYILYAERFALKKLGLPSMDQVIAKNKWKEFNKISCNKLNEMCNIQYYYKAYDITLNKGAIRESIEEMEYKKSRSSLNKNICRKVIVNANNRHKKELNKGWSNRIERSNEYVNNYKVLTTNLLKNTVN